ncbi:MAG: outer membrane beta-barrel protein [Saprospiraceae bacterium]
MGKIKHKFRIFIFILISSAPVFGQVAFNIKSTVSRSIWTDEMSSSVYTFHQGYTIGFDMIVYQGIAFFMPGIHFQNTSLNAVDINWNKPYRNYTSIKSFKLPIQGGLYIVKSKLIDLGVHAGIAGTYNIDVDKNENVLEEDLASIRVGLLTGAILRLSYLTLHTSYEYGLSRIFSPNNPSGIKNDSKEKIFSVGLGFQF